MSDNAIHEFFFAPRGYRNNSPSIAERIDASGDCWLWTGWKTQHGYGRIQTDFRIRPAHRLIYEMLVGEEVAPELDMDHLCKTPSCVNPDHLEPVDRATNIKRGRGSTRDRCKRGHLGKYEEFAPNKWRCNTCAVLALRRWRAQHG